MSFIVDAQSLTGGRASVGGKAAQLALLQHAGLPVPAWFALTTAAMETFLRDNALEPSPPDDADLEAFAAETEAAFLRASMPAALHEALHQKLSSGRLETYPVAVRSSGVDEDAGERSFAGQYASILNVSGLEQVVDAIKRCWASAWTARVMSYRRLHGLPNRGVRMGVVIQRMVDAEISGVAFSRTPVRPLDRAHLLVSAVLGLGEGLVSGALDADEFELDRSSLAMTASKLADKREALRRSDAGGLRVQPVPVQASSSPALSAAQLREVGALCLACERHAGCPQDVEWAIDGTGLHLLQSRPITSLPADQFYDPAVNGAEPTLWDNSNIIESYCGVTTPLTFSVASAAYRQVYLQFCQVMGVPQETVDAYEGVYRNMLGLIRGRIYYNLINWYRLLLILPGASTNNAFMETMMGVKQGLDPSLQGLFEFMKTPPRHSLSSRIRLAATTLQRFAQVDAIVGDFQARFGEVYEAMRHEPLDKLSLPALAARFQRLSDQVLRRWQAPIINDYLTMIFFGLLKQLTAAWVDGGEAGTALHNDLLCGEGDLESTEPTKMLMRIAQSIGEGPEARRDWVTGTPADELWRQMAEQGAHPELYASFRDFLDRYGFRCVNELKLEEPDLHDDPTFVVAAVASYVRQRAWSIEAMEAREREIRRKAEEQARAKLALHRRAQYFWVVRQARKAVRNRENLRFARTKVFGLARHIFREMGLRLASLHVIRRADDVFYLTLDEVLGYVEGRPATLGLGALAAARRVEFDEYRKGPPPPDRFLTYGAVGSSLRYAQVLADADLLRAAGATDDPSLLKGIPCCPGVVEGTVRVVRDMRDAQGLHGEILVTERTDPGWVPLYPSCSGLLIERGSLLSHSAVVARELGLPAVVGVSGGLMRRLKTGQRVRLDGGAGEVRILP